MTELQGILRGRAWTFGDSVDTNQLAGGGLPGATREETLRINCLRGLRPDFTEGVREGDIIVAGHNFGLGSGRQSAVEALHICGVKAVIAESVARIHGRNSIALALPTFAVPGISDLIHDHDQIEIDFERGEVRNADRGGGLPLPTVPASVADIYAAGGLLEVIGRRLREQGHQPTPTPS